MAKCTLGKIIDSILGKEGLPVTYENKGRSMVRLSEFKVTKSVLRRLRKKVMKGEL